MSDISDFILARLADEESAAIAADWIGDNKRWQVEPAPMGKWLVYATGEKFHRKATADHIVRHDPTRVLADCKAKRRIVWKAKELAEWDEMGSSTRDTGEDILEALASAYADHPDYDDNWRL